MRLQIRTARQSDRERRTFTDTSGIRAHRPAVQLDELLDHRQTNTHALLRATRPWIRLSKDLEDVRQERRIDSLPVVRDCQKNLVILFFESNNDAAAARRKLHRVVEQVPDDLLEPHRISL